MLLAAGSGILTRCRVSATTKPDESATQTKELEPNEFVSSASDGRSVEWATFSDAYEKIDFTKLRSKTVNVIFSLIGNFKIGGLVATFLNVYFGFTDILVVFAFASDYDVIMPFYQNN